VKVLKRNRIDVLSRWRWGVQPRHRFLPRGRKALQGYLLQAIRNRIRDERRQEESAESDATRRYRSALDRLQPDERDLVIARLRLRYTYEQVALATALPSAEAARAAVRRALVRLAEEMDRV
jgi:DNA-directed RNA polymerase specialized sigma24 family protein